MQKVLVMTTQGCGMRSTAEGWSCEDGNSFSHAKSVKFEPSLWHSDNIGMIPGVRFSYSYGAPLLALSDGWKLLAPPSQGSDGQWEWWFTKD